MTVSELLPDGELVCKWFDKSRKHNQQVFPVETVEEASPGDYWDG